MTSLRPSLDDEPSLPARLAAWIVRDGLDQDQARQTKSIDLMALAMTLLDPDEAKRERTLQAWPRPLDESALPMLGQAAARMPQAVASVPFPWLTPWVPGVTSLVAAHQVLNLDARVMRAANLWQQPWSPGVLMLGSPRYWKCWVDDTLPAHGGVRGPQPGVPALSDAVIERMTRQEQGVRQRLLEALAQRGVLDTHSLVLCPTVDSQQAIPLGVALTAMGTPLPEAWSWPRVAPAQWWLAVASGLDEYPSQAEPWLPQIRRLARSGRLTLDTEARAQFDQVPAHSPWPWATGVLVARVLMVALRADMRMDWLGTATQAMIDGLDALPRDRRQGLLAQIVEDGWVRNLNPTYRQRDMVNFTQHLLSQWRDSDRHILAQDLMEACRNLPAINAWHVSPTRGFFGVSLVNNTRDAHQQGPSPWQGALTHDDLVALTDVLWSHDFQQTSTGQVVPSTNNAHAWPPSPYLFKVALAAPAEYSEPLLRLAEDWARIDNTQPKETRRLEFLGRYTQLLARRAIPEAPAARQRM